MLLLDVKVGTAMSYEWDLNRATMFDVKSMGGCEARAYGSKYRWLLRRCGTQWCFVCGTPQCLDYDLNPDRQRENPASPKPNMKPFTFP